MDVLRLTLRQLQVFAAVARRGSTIAASGEIALSQSATSAAVNELERTLSLRLFDRAGKRLLLNDSGRALLPRALALLDGAAEIGNLASDSLAQARTLRVGASTTIGNYLLPSLLGPFLGVRERTQSDAWRARVTIDNTEAICDAVAAFEIDIGLIEGPCHRAGVDVAPWLRDDLVLVASPALVSEHLSRERAESGRVPLRALRGMVWLLRESGSGTREATDQLLLPHVRSYRRSIELGSSEAIKHAAAEGLGIACLSRWVVHDLVESARLWVVPTALPRMTRQCYLAVHHDKQPTPTLLRFISHAKAWHDPAAVRTAAPGQRR